MRGFFTRPPNVALIRAWALTICGVAAIIDGFLTTNPTIVMLGFAVLGGEPMSKAATIG